MKNVFARTGNVDMFVHLVGSLEKRSTGMDGMGLVFGEPGLGKSRTAIWYADKINAVYYRAKEHTTLRSLLEGIVVELGQAPGYRTSDLYNQITATLQESNRTVFIDEIDYLTTRGGGIETLRDIADETGVAVILIGMMDAERKVARFKHLYDRLAAHVLRFRPLSEQEIQGLASQVCEVALDESAVKEVHLRSGGKLRKIFQEFNRAEKVARANDLKTVNGGHLKKAA